MMLLRSLRAWSTLRATQCEMRSVVGLKTNLVVSHKANLLQNAATSCDRSFSTGQDFKLLVDREIGVEAKNRSDQFHVFAMLQRSLIWDWHIVHGEVDYLVQMYKRKLLKKDGSGIKAVVEFHCPETEVNENNQEAVPDVRFVVSFQKLTQCMIVQCLVKDDELIIEGVQTRDLALGESPLLLAKQSKTPYTKPTVSKFSSDFRQSLLDFVQTECGVSTNVIKFISMYPAQKDNIDYMKWLKTVRELMR